MKVVFLESPVFTRLLNDYLTDDDYRALQPTLMQNPDAGQVMPGSGGFRKVRWGDVRRGKGRRSGLRVIYYHLKRDEQIWFVTLYAKDEVEDLTVEEKRMLRIALATELAARGRRT